MAWDSSSSSSDEPSHRRKPRGNLSGTRKPRQIPRLLLADSSTDDEIKEISGRQKAEREREDALTANEVADKLVQKAENGVDPSDPSHGSQLAEKSEFDSNARRTGWRFKKDSKGVDGNCSDRSKSPRSPGRRARWNSQAMKIRDLTPEIKVFDRLYNNFRQKTQVEKLPSKPKGKDSEGQAQVFTRLYEDAMVKREVAKMREARVAKEIKEKEQQPVRLQAPEEEVMAMCQRLYDRRKVKESAPVETPKVQDPAEALEASKKLHSFVQHQNFWNANREAKAEAERLKQLDAERRYLEENSIHRSLTPVHGFGCYDRLYKDFDKRAIRLEKLRTAQQNEDLVTPKSSPRSGVDTTKVSARLHGHFEERKHRLDQKRQEQEDYIRWRSQDPLSLRSARSRSPRTPSTATALSQTSSEGTWRTRPGTPRGNSRCATPEKSRSPRNAIDGSNQSNGTKDGDEQPTQPKSAQPDGHHSHHSAEKADSTPKTPSLRAQVEVTVNSARGALLETNRSWTCFVEVGEAAKPKKTILQTEQQTGGNPTWNSKAQATLFQADILQFKICDTSGECMAQTSLSVASILMICYSGFDGELKLQPPSAAKSEEDAIYLHVWMRILDVTERRKSADQLEQVEEPEKRASAPRDRKVHPHEGYKVKAYSIVKAQKAQKATEPAQGAQGIGDRGANRAKSLPRSASPRNLSGSQLRDSSHSKVQGKESMRSMRGMRGMSARRNKDAAKTGRKQARNEENEDHQAQLQLSTQTLRGVSFDRTARTTRSTRSARSASVQRVERVQSSYVEVLISEPFVTVNIEDKYLPRHLRDLQ